ncbi:alpha-N-acetylneuraminide alpha-2,8-sialyltransferase-like [Saccoglossus kowalevskii]
MHPTHMIETRRHWKKWGINKIMSTGFYLVSVAIELCDEVQLYGFWPFTVSPRGKPVSYHYYDDLNFTTTHNFSAEFDVLVKLHELGVVELNVDCH